MALSFLIAPQNKGLAIGEWEFDATTAETVDAPVEVSAFPVEDGSTITDHATVSPRTISITGIITAAPLDTADQFSDRLGWLMDDMFELRKRREPVAIFSEIGLFENMLISSVSATFSTDGGQAIALDVTMTEVLIANSVEVFIPALALKPKKFDPALYDSVFAVDPALLASRASRGVRRIELCQEARKKLDEASNAETDTETMKHLYNVTEDEVGFSLEYCADLGVQI
jgi:hypothetical protein